MTAAALTGPTRNLVASHTTFDTTALDPATSSLIKHAAISGIGINHRSGDAQIHPLSQAARITLEDVALPTRAPMAYQGQRSKPGYFFMASVNELVSYESRFEMYHLMAMDRTATVTALVPQPFRVHWTPIDGRARIHTPDFFFRLADGSALVLDVKGTRAAADSQNQLVFGVTARAMASVGWEYRVASDFNPAVLANLRWLAAYRQTPPSADVLAPFLLDHAEGSTVTALVTTASTAADVNPLLVRQLLFHLIWTGDINFTETIPLTEQTVLTLRDVTL